MPAEKRTIICSDCTKTECREGYPEGIPPWCATTKFNNIIEETKVKYSDPANLNIYLAANNVIKNGYGKWPRIQEAIEFTRELKLSKIGLAACVALVDELRLVAKLFKGAGFEVVASACKVGGIYQKDLDINSDRGVSGFSCNPIAQAEICNNADTQMNFILGLCLGHDILFMQHSKAPTSVLIVKDRVTGHNPSAVLYAYHPRKSLINQYCSKEQQK